MKENNFLKIIQSQVGNKYIGDDCAFLKDLGIVITQDSLVENIHFKRSWATPYQIGYKSIVVNISDVLASGAIPKYLTVSLSLPKNTDSSFVKEFYRGANAGLYGAEIVGGDITGSEDKIYISVSAIGVKENRNISSRKNAKYDYIIITHGNYGSSAEGLNELKSGIFESSNIKSHLEPELNLQFSKKISETVKEPYAMMDTSDGLADALFKIAEASNLTIEVDYDKIPHKESINNPNSILFGGEDYNLVAAIPSIYTNTFSEYHIIGHTTTKKDSTVLKIGNKKYSLYDELKVYNHFEGINNGK